MPIGLMAVAGRRFIVKLIDGDVGGVKRHKNEPRLLCLAVTVWRPATPSP